MNVFQTFCQLPAQAGLTRLVYFYSIFPYFPGESNDDTNTEIDTTSKTEEKKQENTVQALDHANGSLTSAGQMERSDHLHLMESNSTSGNFNNLIM